MNKNVLSYPFRKFTKILIFILVIDIIISYFDVINKINNIAFYPIINNFKPFLIFLGTYYKLIILGILLLIIASEFGNFMFLDYNANILTVDDQWKAFNWPKDEILIIIPCYNEEKSLFNAIEIAKKFGKVLVIDDGSTDNSYSIAKKHADFVIRHFFNLGLAYAIKSGIQFGVKHHYKYFAIFDADLQYKGEDLGKVLYVLINNNYDLVMGSRLSGVIEEMPILKKIGNILFSKTLSYITGIPVSDGQTGLRSFNFEFASIIKIRSEFTYTQQMIFEAARYKIKVAEIPIYFRKRSYGQSRLMKGAIDYAIRAWLLNIRILLEYNPVNNIFKLFSVLLLLLTIIRILLFNRVVYSLNNPYFEIVVFIILSISITLLVIIPIMIKMINEKEKDITEYSFVIEN